LVGVGDPEWRPPAMVGAMKEFCSLHPIIGLCAALAWGLLVGTVLRLRWVKLRILAGLIIASVWLSENLDAFAIWCGKRIVR
jgi:hypothetical protein